MVAMVESTEQMTRAGRSVMLTVTDVIAETHDACSLVFAVPDDDRERLAYRPGQFLTLRVPSDREGSVARCYSLASSPLTDDAPKVTVKRTATGYGSNWLCDNVRVGDLIEVLPPAGTFTPTELDRDFLLWAGGSGITPVLSILKSALAAGSGRVVLIYANRDERSVIFAAELSALAQRYPRRLIVLHWLETVQGIPLPGQLAELAVPFASYTSYICGPAPFMSAVQDALGETGVTRDRIHVEVFRSLTGDPFTPADLTEAAAPEDVAAAARVEVDLDGQRHRLAWPRQSTLVDVMTAAGIDVPYSCREGQCGSCVCTVLSGEVAMATCDILEPEDLQDGLILGCQARPVTDELHIAF
jgi:3-ketosteroid 9alpha-monooxygenase subunit B